MPAAAETVRAREDLEAAAERVMAEGAEPLGRLAQRVPAARAGRGPRGHASSYTLLRWVTRGRDGVFLDGVRMAGSGWYSSAKALVRFFAAITEAELLGAVPPKLREHERRAKAASEELDRLRRGE